MLMKQIFHIVAGNLFGGVESFLVTLAKSKALERDIIHRFAICFPGRLCREIADAGAPVEMIGPARIMGISSTKKAKKILDAALLKHSPEVIVCHMSWAQIIFGGVATKHGKWVAHHHGPSTNSWMDWIAVKRSPDLVISPSMDSSSTWFKKYRRNVNTLNYPVRQVFVDASKNISKANARSRFSLPQNKILIVQCSRIEPWKGHDVLLEALARINSNENWHMLFAGAPQKRADQVYFGNLQEQCKKLGLSSRVSWLGDVEEVHTLMLACDIYCQANRGPEGFSLAFLEASFCGLPIVTTRLGGASEIVEGNGFLVSEPSPALFAEKLNLLINDSNLRNKQSEAAFNIGNRMGYPSNQVVKYENLCLGEGSGK